MTPTEAVTIAKYVASLCPQQRFNEHTPDTWGDVLAPYDVADARTAVVAVAARQPFVAPAELIAEIRSVRAARIAAANLVYDGNPDETGLESGLSLRALIRTAAEGYAPPAAIGGRLRHAIESGEPSAEEPRGRARALLASVGQRPPTVREGVVNPRAVPCPLPKCLALPGASCRTSGRPRVDVHPARLEDAKRAAAGLPPADPADRAREEASRRAAAAHAAAATPTPADFGDVT